eukprot:CAMPEP_0173150388 /NCGR_PEP_ID=MMETSP1105-20130129/10934_1 /TAXON_ID=2985 /ORGANISM="Ochromonas sp., Strain BG-1" /LENGTH=377 /DNA_ID=CAMNT_0014065521 /DNA_START=58 /DNA_END=1191 /DNA_ORIENTATION=+
MDLFHEGNIHFIDEDYDLAVKSYTEVIKKNAELYQAFLHRGTAHLKVKHYKEAIEDFNKALEINADCELAYYRLGVAYFESEEYRSAKSAFEVGLTLRQKEAKRDVTNYTRYIRKCEAELSDLKAAENAPPAPPSKPAAPAAQPVANITLPIKYQYYQSLSSLTIDVMVKNRTPEDVAIDISPTHLKVLIRYKITNGDKTTDHEEVVIDKDLFAQINTEKSKFQIYKTKIEITLSKIDQEQWPAIEANGAPRLPVASRPLDPPPVDDNPKPAKVPKAYASSRDWDKVGSEISKELEQEKPEGEEAMAALFRQIFKDADPETRMAMKKSFQTSGGTVLSTNWKEVKDTDYETVRQAPKGVEWKNWEGQKIEKQKQFDD